MRGGLYIGRVLATGDGVTGSCPPGYASLEFRAQKSGSGSAEEGNENHLKKD
jgi:hypothetical protein